MVGKIPKDCGGEAGTATQVSFWREGMDCDNDNKNNNTNRARERKKELVTAAYHCILILHKAIVEALSLLGHRLVHTINI